jgi:hypothetical protein
MEASSFGKPSKVCGPSGGRSNDADVTGAPAWAQDGVPASLAGSVHVDR